MYIKREDAIKELREVYENEYPTASGDFDEYASHDVPNVLRNISAADVQPALNEKEYESLCKRMAECANMGVEDGHIAADDILLEALEKMGYKKLTEIYLNLDKWYA